MWSFEHDALSNKDIPTHRSAERISAALPATNVVTSIRLVIAASLTLHKEWRFYICNNLGLTVIMSNQTYYLIYLYTQTETYAETQDTQHRWKNAFQYQF